MHEGVLRQVVARETGAAPAGPGRAASPRWRHDGRLPAAHAPAAARADPRPAARGPRHGQLFDNKRIPPRGSPTHLERSGPKCESPFGLAFYQGKQGGSPTEGRCGYASVGQPVLSGRSEPLLPATADIETTLSKDISFLYRCSISDRALGIAEIDNLNFKIFNP